LVVGLIVLAGLAAYHNGFSGVMILDDLETIQQNSSIRHLWPLRPILSPPAPSGVAGRPLANFTFALSYAASGPNVWSYHALNLLIHLLAACTLFGVVRRTLLQPFMRDRFGSASLPLALAIAGLWTVHPLQTQVVDYLSQRTEGLMGLCYLLTLYCFIRGAEAKPSRWFPLSILACLCGVWSKEVIATAPLLVFLYDRTFIAGTFRAAWRQRWRYYLGLSAIWLVLGGSLLGLQARGAGFGSGVSVYEYALTECKAVVLYLGLALWPHPLIFDRGADFLERFADAAPYALVLGSLLIGTWVALRRWPALGFAGCWIFIILAPTSSVVPLFGQPMAESRMYLPLAAVIALVVLGIYRFSGRHSLWVWAAVAVGLSTLTLQRNLIYRSAEALWRDTMAKCPQNPRAHLCLGRVLIELGRMPEAISCFETAVRIEPTYATGHYNLGCALLQTGRLPEAVSHFQTTVNLTPDFFLAHYNLGVAAQQMNRMDEAVQHFETTLRLKPDYAAAYNNLGTILMGAGKFPEAQQKFEQAVRCQPDYTVAQRNLGTMLIQAGQIPAAIEHLKTALRAEPGHAGTFMMLAIAFDASGQKSEAIRSFEQAARLAPEDVFLRQNFATCLLKYNRVPEAIQQLEQIVRLQPDYNPAQQLLGSVLFQTGRSQDAIPHLQAALREKSEQVEPYLFLGIALAQANRVPEAIPRFEEALHLAPDDPVIHYNLGSAFLAAGRLREAIAQLEETVRLKPDHAIGHYNLSIALARAGRIPEAIQHCTEALRFKPDFTEARNLLAQMRAKSGQTARFTPSP